MTSQNQNRVAHIETDSELLERDRNKAINVDALGAQRRLGMWRDQSADEVWSGRQLCGASAGRLGNSCSDGP